jgi:murein DD-endopeptidase MepM/ murein hydrolase activator NlpD
MEPGRYEIERKSRQNAGTTIFKNWLIIDTSAPSDSIPLSDDQKHRISVKGTAIGIAALVVIGYPILAHANVFQTLPVKAIFANSKPEIITDTTAREHNSQTTPLLQAATNLDPNPARGGADLNIIENKALVAESGVGGGFVEIVNRKNDAISIYQVKEGDTLSQIANMFDVSVNTIKWANNLEGGAYPGQSLVILPISGIKHTVKSGGTIGDIAKKYGADAKEIALFNGISVDAQLEEGQEIIVPNVDLAQSDTKKATKATAKSSTKSSGSSTASSGGGSSNWMIKPINGAVRTQGIHGYNAVDLAAPVGTPIYAAAEGTVIIANSNGAWNGGYGNYVVIKHANGAQTLYAHMSSVLVSVGESVSQGVQIGAVGMTGKSTGAHLHFEVRGAKNPF